MNNTTLTTYRQAADTLFPIRGAWSYDAWDAINARFWDNQLTPGPILWGLTAGCNFGTYNPNNNAITLHEALPGKDFAKEAKQQGINDWVMANRDQSLNSWGLSSKDFGIGTALGTLLHESMHQAHHQRGVRYPLNRKGTGTESHHNRIWIAECERVANLIGISPRLWALYVERKERVDEVRQRLGAAAEQLTSKQLNNRRQWVWVPTIDGEEIATDEHDDGTETYKGQLVAQPEEITGFPRNSFKQMGVKVADRVELILPSKKPAAKASKPRAKFKIGQKVTRVNGLKAWPIRRRHFAHGRWFYELASDLSIGFEEETNFTAA